MADENDAQKGESGRGGGGFLKEILTDLRERRSPWSKAEEEPPVGAPTEWGGPSIKPDHYRRMQDRYSRNY